MSLNNFTKLPMTRGYMAHRVVLKYESGCVETHPLSIVRLHDDGSLSVSPFEREVAGVEFHNGTLTFECHQGHWKLITSLHS